MSQSLEEVDFDRSPCGLAQRGLAERLAAAVSSRERACERDSAGYAPLHYAARGGHEACVRILLAAGADPGARTRAGAATPLHRAAWVGALGCVNLLLESAAGGSALCLAVDDEGMTALHKACQNNHLHVAARLEQACAEAAEVVDARGRTPRDMLPAARGGGAPSEGHE